MIKTDNISKTNYTILILMIVVVSATFGFIYETIFYKFDLGYFIKRGATIGPWLPIYGVGGILITLTTKRFENKPFIILLISCLVCGLLEFFTGYILYEFIGIRLWDYNVEIFNFGNIGGYICLRSILFFGISGIFLIKVIIPFLIKIHNKAPKIFNYVSIILSFLFFIDVFINYILIHILK